jgi:hypothetical protein
MALDEMCPQTAPVTHSPSVAGEACTSAVSACFDVMQRGLEMAGTLGMGGQAARLHFGTALDTSRSCACRSSTCSSCCRKARDAAECAWMAALTEALAVCTERAASRACSNRLAHGSTRLGGCASCLLHSAQELQHDLILGPAVHHNALYICGKLIPESACGLYSHLDH